MEASKEKPTLELELESASTELANNISDKELAKALATLALTS